MEVSSRNNAQTDTDFMKAVHKLMKKMHIFTHLNITTFYFLYLSELLTVKMSWNPSAITVCKFIKSNSPQKKRCELTSFFLHAVQFLMD